MSGITPVSFGHQLGDVAQMEEQMRGGRLRIVLRRHEADEIRERLFAEEGIHRRPVVGHAPALKEFEVIDRRGLVGRDRA